MKKKNLLFSAAVLCAGLTGCIFGGSSSQPQIFSLRPGVEKRAKLPCQVKFLLFRNLSGADRRFLYRQSENLVYGHEFCRWVLDPELMFERFLRESVQGEGNENVRVRGVITCFEFDIPGKRAVLAVDFTLFGGERSRSFTLREEQFWDVESDETGVAAAAAMEKCSIELAGKLQQQILLLLEDIKKGNGK